MPLPCIMRCHGHFSQAHKRHRARTLSGTTHYFPISLRQPDNPTFIANGALRVIQSHEVMAFGKVIPTSQSNSVA
jgi:hypothetical protein